MSVWYRWPLNSEGLPAQDGEDVVEVHVVPEQERMRHRPQKCWCNPVLDIQEKTPRFIHKVMWINNGLTRAS